MQWHKKMSIFTGVGLLSCLLLALVPGACSQAGAVPYRDLSNRYLFLFFPAPDCAKDECPTRVLLVSKRELDTGTVEYMDPFHANRSIALQRLTLVPSAEARLLLQTPEESLSIGGYSAMNWRQTVGKDGAFETHLELRDSKHGRVETYGYRVLNGRVVEGYPSRTFSWVDLSFMFVATLFALFLFSRLRRTRMIPDHSRQAPRS